MNRQVDPTAKPSCSYYAVPRYYSTIPTIWYASPDFPSFQSYFQDLIFPTVHYALRALNAGQLIRSVDATVNDLPSDVENAFLLQHARTAEAEWQDAYTWTPISIEQDEQTLDKQDLFGYLYGPSGIGRQSAAKGSAIVVACPPWVIDATGFHQLTNKGTLADFDPSGSTTGESDPLTVILNKIAMLCRRHNTSFFVFTNGNLWTFGRLFHAKSGGVILALTPPVPFNSHVPNDYPEEPTIEIGTEIHRLGLQEAWPVSILSALTCWMYAAVTSDMAIRSVDMDVDDPMDASAVDDMLQVISPSSSPAPEEDMEDIQVVEEMLQGAHSPSPSPDTQSAGDLSMEDAQAVDTMLDAVSSLTSIPIRTSDARSQATSSLSTPPAEHRPIKLEELDQSSSSVLLPVPGPPPGLTKRSLNPPSQVSCSQLSTHQPILTASSLKGPRKRSITDVLDEPESEQEESPAKIPKLSSAEVTPSSQSTSMIIVAAEAGPNIRPEPEILCGAEVEVVSLVVPKAKQSTTPAADITSAGRSAKALGAPRVKGEPEMDDRVNVAPRRSTRVLNKRKAEDVPVSAPAPKKLKQVAKKTVATAVSKGKTTRGKTVQAEPAAAAKVGPPPDPFRNPKARHPFARPLRSSSKRGRETQDVDETGSTLSIKRARTVVIEQDTNASAAAPSHRRRAALRARQTATSAPAPRLSPPAPPSSPPMVAVEVDDAMDIDEREVPPPELQGPTRPVRDRQQPDRLAPTFAAPKRKGVTSGGRARRK